MVTKKVFIIALVLFLFLGVISASAATLNTSAVTLPWNTQVMDDDESGVQNLSTAFVGKNQIPMLSYSLVGSPRIYQIHMATTAVPGNCGPNDDWYCTYWDDPALIPGTVSNMATMQIIDTHLIKWAYSISGKIRGATIELMNDMSPVYQDFEDLIQINKFGATIIGQPSLPIRGGHYEMAVTIRDSSDLFGHKLVYMHYTGNDLKYSCTDSGSVYECDVIDVSSGYASMGAPSLQIADDGTVGIAYYKNGELMYAYPHVPVFGWPSNCGPGGNTWRCIPIFSGTVTGTVGNVVKFAFGQTGSERGIAFTYDDVLIPVSLYHAEYVGSGGNCGEDLGFGGMPVNRWNCENIVLFYYLNPAAMPSFSIDIDPEGFPVMAYDFAMDDLGNKDLYITYPKERAGISDPGWIAQRIDGAPVYSVNTGSQAALALNNAGLGFISYLQEIEYEPDILKIALQEFNLYLPSLMH